MVYLRPMLLTTSPCLAIVVDPQFVPKIFRIMSTAANEMFLLEPAWRESTEIQGIKRISRIGQTVPDVYAWKLLTPCSTMHHSCKTLRFELMPRKLQHSQECQQNMSLIENIRRSFTPKETRSFYGYTKDIQSNAYFAEVRTTICRSIRSEETRWQSRI